MAVAMFVAASHASSRDELSDTTTSTREVDVTSIVTAQAVLEKALLISLASRVPILVFDTSAFGARVPPSTPMSGNAFNLAADGPGAEAAHSNSPSSAMFVRLN
ncbi:hypothetical protein [Saccharothrix coeruleofusca]|uniref:hypothetical protein n=1 Tax=Saccharothrix coeruleofusca TaxID=33919 RepID=UPI001670AE62|nr:hypothetical protein [Saccharothrix coeruleofusca]